MSELTGAMKAAGRTALGRNVFKHGNAIGDLPATNHAGRALALASNTLGHPRLAARTDLARALSDVAVESGQPDDLVRMCARFSEPSLATTARHQEISDRIVDGLLRPISGADDVAQQRHAFKSLLELSERDPLDNDIAKLYPEADAVADFVAGLRCLARGCS